MGNEKEPALPWMIALIFLAVLAPIGGSMLMSIEFASFTVQNWFWRSCAAFFIMGVLPVGVYAMIFYIHASIKKLQVGHLVLLAFIVPSLFFSTEPVEILLQGQLRLRDQVISYGFSDGTFNGQRPDLSRGMRSGDYRVKLRDNGSWHIQCPPVCVTVYRDLRGDKESLFVSLLNTELKIETLPAINRIIQIERTEFEELKKETVRSD